jgi:hypothetical protein
MTEKRKLHKTMLQQIGKLVKIMKLAGIVKLNE